MHVHSSLTFFFVFIGTYMFSLAQKQPSPLAGAAPSSNSSVQTSIGIVNVVALTIICSLACVNALIFSVKFCSLGRRPIATTNAPIFALATANDPETLTAPGLDVVEEDDTLMAVSVDDAVGGQMHQH